MSLPQFLKMNLFFLVIVLFGLTACAPNEDDVFDQKIRFKLKETEIVPDIQQAPGDALKNKVREGFTLERQENGTFKIHATHPAYEFYARNVLSTVPDLSHTVEATPYYAYRALHMDVARHYLPIPAIKRYIQQMALLRFNTLHFHITDDQGWRFQVLAYPQLTDTGAYRYNSDTDTVRYGNFYTQAELRELVAFAKQYHVTIIPEIDFPSHARSAIASIPSLSCTGKPEIVGRVVDNPPGCSTYCVGNPEAFTFAKRVLDELCDVFPGTYIHIGGDECDASPWTKCPKCLALAQNTFGDSMRTHDLQYLFLNQLIEYLHTEKGRRAIVWDEYASTPKLPLDAPKPVVMIWQSRDRYDEIKHLGYPMIMAPSNNLYLDYRQGHIDIEPFGDHTLRIKDVYGIDLPKDDNIIGICACLWAEAIDNEAKLVYMLQPRVLAVAERAWFGPNAPSWFSFQSKITPYIANWTRIGRTPSMAAYQVQFSPVLPIEKNKIKVFFNTEAKVSPHRENSFFYALDTDSDYKFKPAKAEGITLTKSGKLCAYLGQSDVKPVHTMLPVVMHKGIGNIAPDSTTSPHKNYFGNAGIETLADGLIASSDYRDRNWCGFESKDPIEVVFQFDTDTTIQSVSLNCMSKHNSWILYPAQIEIFADNQKVATYQGEKETFNKLIQQKDIVIPFAPVKAQNVRIKISPAPLPEGHFMAGRHAWIFCSEIAIQ